MARTQRRDARGRFSSGGGIGAAVGRRMRLRANEKRAASRASMLTGIAPGGKSPAVQKIARKIDRSIKINNRAARVYRSRRGSL